MKHPFNFWSRAKYAAGATWIAVLLVMIGKHLWEVLG